jgi:hypothetical protein
MTRGRFATRAIVLVLPWDAYIQNAVRTNCKNARKTISVRNDAQTTEGNKNNAHQTKVLFRL